jgi:hypothetical protein
MDAVAYPKAFPLVRFVITRKVSPGLYAGYIRASAIRPQNGKKLDVRTDYPGSLHGLRLTMVLSQYRAY